MNLVGKIFTVLIFLMCVVFGTFARWFMRRTRTGKRKSIKGRLNDQLIEANKEKRRPHRGKEESSRPPERRERGTLKAADRPGASGRTMPSTAAEGQRRARSRSRKRKAASWPWRFKRSSRSSACCRRQSTACGSDIKVAVDERNSTAKETRGNHRRSE